MILTADFHTHILPTIDDGSQSVSDSIEMIRQEQADGISTIFLTPHFYPQRMHPDSFIAKRHQAITLLQNACLPEMQIPRLIIGAEVLFCPGMSQWEQLDTLVLGATNYILIEMPHVIWSDSILDELVQIHSKRGITPILAHIERYLPVIGANQFINRLHDLPILCQSNSDFLTNKRTQRLALKLIREQKIHLIGSDCHSSTWRAPTMGQAREVLLNNVDQQTLTFLEKYENLVIPN